MPVLEEIIKRCSVRAYEDRPVEEEKLSRILEAARQAPSARNLQQWRFLVVTDPKLRAALAEAASMQKFVGQAPVVIVGCGTQPDYVMRCGQPAYAIDVAIALEHIALQAVREGLGTCWIGSFNESEVKRILEIPDPVRVVELMTLGYPAYDYRPHDRVPIDRIVAYERWPKEWKVVSAADEE